MINFKPLESGKSKEQFNVIMEFRDKLTEFIDETMRYRFIDNEMSFEQELSDSFEAENNIFIAKVEYNCNAEYPINFSYKFPDFYGNTVEESGFSVSPDKLNINSIIFDIILHIFPNTEE